MEQQKDYTGTWIPAFVMEDKRLKPLEKILYAEIACFVDCFKSNSNLAERLGVSESYISDMIKHLITLKYIKQTSFDGRSRHLKAITNISPNKRKITEEPITTVLGRVAPQTKSAYNHSATIDNNIENNIEKESYVETQNVYDHYIKSFNKNPSYYKLTDTRKKKIRRRLKEYSLDVLLKAIDNVAHSPWHTGDNDRGWKADLDWIIKSEEQVGKLAEMEVKQGERIAHMKLNLETGKMEEIYE